MAAIATDLDHAELRMQHSIETHPIQRKLDPACAQADLFPTDAAVSRFVLVAPIRLRPVSVHVVGLEAITDWDFTLKAGDTTIAEGTLDGDAEEVFEIDVEDVVVAEGAALLATLTPGDAAEDLTGKQICISFAFTHAISAA